MPRKISESPLFIELKRTVADSVSSKKKSHCCRPYQIDVLKGETGGLFRGSSVGFVDPRSARPRDVLDDCSNRHSVNPCKLGLASMSRAFWRMIQVLTYMKQTYLHQKA